MQSVDEHKAAGPAQVRCGVITVSDTRTAETDTGGRLLQHLLEGAGHAVCHRAWVRDDVGAITAAIDAAVRAGADVVVTTGGTGIAPRDVTYEAVTALLEKQLDGFGELFRLLSYRAIGTAALLSRATAGVARGVVIVALPGSEAAVRLAVTEVLLPELVHLVQQARRA